MEIWKPFKSHKGLYEVSNLGRVKRLRQVRTFRNQFTEWSKEVPEYVFSPCKDSKGYFQVLLSLDSRRVARVHRLVAEAFIPNPEGKPCVNHKDGNKLNNKVENLEWCTISENNQHTYDNNSRDGSKINGESNFNNKLTMEEVEKIWDLLGSSNYSQQKIAEMFDVKQITISNIKTKRSWKWLTDELQVH